MKYLFLVLTLLLQPFLSAEESSADDGWLRKRVKERIVKRLESRPAPRESPECASKIERAGDYICSLKVDDLQRYFKIHVPAEANLKKPLPLVLSFHGGGGSMQIQSDNRYYGLTAKSDQEKYIAVFPNGYSKLASGDFATWNAGKCCADARDKKIDDVKFVRALVEKVKALLPIEHEQIYATGMSNGGMMSYRLACEASDIFKAIAAVAGTDATTDCKPVKPVSIFHIHALDDDHVLYEGGAGKNAFKDRTKVTEFTSVADTIKKWKNLNNCKGKPELTILNNRAQCETYTNCKNHAVVKLCTTASGGHSWPGGKKPLGGKSTSALNATNMIWDFFQSSSDK